MTNKWQCKLLKLKNKNCQNIKSIPHIFISLRSNASVSIYPLLCYSFVETIFKTKLNTLPKYMDTLTIYYADIINPMWGIMPL